MLARRLIGYRLIPAPFKRENRVRLPVGRLRGGAVRQLTGLITQRSQVQILPPPPVSYSSTAERAAVNRLILVRIQVGEPGDVVRYEPCQKRALPVAFHGAITQPGQSATLSRWKPPVQIRLVPRSHSTMDQCTWLRTRRMGVRVPLAVRALCPRGAV